MVTTIFLRLYIERGKTVGNKSISDGGKAVATLILRVTTTYSFNRKYWDRSAEETKSQWGKRTRYAISEEKETKFCCEKLLRFRKGWK